MHSKHEELSEKELGKISGGVLNAIDSNGTLCEIVVGDIVNISGYIYDGKFCCVKIDSNGVYKFFEYKKGSQWIEKTMDISSVPSCVVIQKVGHDDDYVTSGVVSGLLS